MILEKAKMVFSHLIIGILFISIASISVNAQTDAELGEATKKLIPLYQQQKYVEALPYAELLIKAIPDNANLQFIYGYCLLGKAKNVKDKEEARQLIIKSRQAFIKSKQLGNQDKLVDALITSLPADGLMSGQFSKNEEAENAMNEAEAVFTQGKYDEALALYQKALKLDPTIYEAALFSGDMFTQKGDFDNAEIWYQKAIKINPDRETAYRYSGTPLMKQKKYDLARDRYVEAYIVEPFSKFSTLGINQWAEITKSSIGHPRIDVPEIKYDASGKATTVMNQNSLTEGSKAWLAYSLTRESWHQEKFARTFPNEKTYRHTLQEETDALRSVLKMAKEQKLAHPQFETLQKLDNEGLLEPYILLALTDDGIFEDYAPYLKTNRPKLRQYVLNFVIGQK
jgi:tetratricopeptide (TPR) repeat protein